MSMKFNLDRLTSAKPGVILIAICATTFLANQANAQTVVANEETALAVRDACNRAVNSPFSGAITSAIGPHTACEVTHIFFEQEDTETTAPYPFGIETDLEWDSALIRLQTQYPEEGLYQTEITIEADPDSPLDAAWFEAARDTLFPDIKDWSAFDVANTPNADGVIEFEFPDNGIYRGPIVDRDTDGSILLIDVVTGNF